MHPNMKPDLDNAELVGRVRAKAAAASTLLAEAAVRHAPVAFANSLGAEDMVLTDLIAKAGLAIDNFTLDTGRLPEETYALMARIQQHYGLKLSFYYPDGVALEAYTREHGINAFYDSVALRRACCHIRKVAPLRRALAGKGAWVTGLRAAQSVTRASLPVEAYDADNGLYKLSPLSDWSEKEVWTYLHLFEVPYNTLHTRFYPSIGCAPCTRPVALGEDVRAGRWWWENPDSKECGLHRK